MTDKIAAFTRGWVADNIVPGPIDITREVDRLAAKMTADARELGISGGELAKSFGDIDDFLTGEFEKAAAAA